MSSPAPVTSPPPSVTNDTTPPTVTFPLRPPANESSISSEPTPSQPDQNRSGSSSALVALGVGIGIGGAVVLVFVAVFVVWFTRRKRRRCALADDLLGLKDGFGGAPQDWQHSAPPSNRKNDGLPPKFTNSSSNFQLSSSSTSSEKPNTTNMSYGNNKTIFTYEDLANATEGFSQANFLGQGGFGYVHKGVLPSGEKVAIKQLKTGSGQGEREFQAEVAIISRVHHKNLVSLVGYCASGIQRMLVYEFVPNNTLEFHLHGQPKIIHRDIKSANILLDNNFEPKVADFGLARFSPETDTHVSTRVIGTFGYLAPEYALTGKLTDKSDVFSFGVVLLELITGRRPIDKAQFLDDNIVDWARPLLTQVLEDGDYSSIADAKLQNNYDCTEMSRMITCAALCVRHLARRRPSMSQIARALEGNLSLKDLDEGIKAGHNKLNGSHASSDFDTAQYREELKKFQKMAFDSQNNSSKWSVVTSNIGQQPSGSSSEDLRTNNDLGSNTGVQQILID
ncbi:proline-rich receptor-like protein kinase PERK1 isoform X2 [Helianthus annuus]|uniref:proline-rich receptor-like protein kinase PERK1 isoform X2 n=1 Tax=Helianthus annuus TaxID=4232 RepID=UPI001652ED06|nr:proline-rich receptor-like protein kinase PERK1 isoform X2 [Helianthus annuus]